MTLTDAIEMFNDLLEAATAMEYQIILAHTHQARVEEFDASVIAETYDPDDFEWVAEQVLTGKNCLTSIGDTPKKLAGQWDVVNTNETGATKSIVQNPVLEDRLTDLEDRAMPFVGRGVPDLFAYDSTESAVWFVEVKRWDGVLRQEQFLWPLKNDQFDHSVMYVKPLQKINSLADKAQMCVESSFFSG